MPTAQIIRDDEIVDNRRCSTEPIAKRLVAWTSASDGTVVYVLGHISGQIVALETKPDAVTAPTAYNVTITDASDNDVLDGLGAARSINTTQKVEIIKEQVVNTRYYGSHPPVNDTLTLNIANAGDAKKGTLVLYYR